MDDRENNSHIEVVDHASEDDQLAETIRGSLEKSVYGGTDSSDAGTGVPKGSEDAGAHAADGSAGESGGSGSPDAAGAQANPAAAGVQANADETAAPAKADSPSDNAKKPEEDFRIVNVMEEILRQRNVPKTMERLGCCTCSRCRADVIAMTLSALPAKYCVASGNDKSPLINFYDQRYNAEITSSIMRSCLMVRDHPRHAQQNGANGSGKQN